MGNNNCLVTKIKAAITNDAAPYFNAFKIWASNPTASGTYSFPVLFEQDATIEYLDETGEIKIIEGTSEKYGKMVTVDKTKAHADTPWIFLCSDKLLGIGVNGNLSAVNFVAASVDVDGLVNSQHLLKVYCGGEMIGNIDNLVYCKEITDLVIPGGDFTGTFMPLCQLIKLSYLRVGTISSETAISLRGSGLKQIPDMDIEDFYVGLLGNGKVGNLEIRFKYAPTISFNGATISSLSSYVDVTYYLVFATNSIVIYSDSDHTTIVASYDGTNWTYVS